MYENQTEEAIKARMLEAVPSVDIDKAEGSFIYDAVAPAAIELAEAYIELDSVLERAFAETSYGEWLDKKSAEFGVYRKPGTKAVGEITVRGADETVIPEGTLVQSEMGLLFKTRAEAVISGESVVVEVEAVEAGTKFNIPAKAIRQLPVQITGVTGVINDEPITGGTSVESDEALLQRLLFKARTPATSGNGYHYRQWALDVAGVGDARVFPLAHGPGTVEVIIVDSNKLPANDELVRKAIAYIEDMRPIGARVTVLAAEPVYIDISARITLDPNYILNTVLQDFKAKTIEYFKSIAFKKDYVSYAQIGSILLDVPGVLDHANLLLNNRMELVTLSKNQVPVINEVVLTSQEVL